MKAALGSYELLGTGECAVGRHPDLGISSGPIFRTEDTHTLYSLCGVAHTRVLRRPVMAAVSNTPTAIGEPLSVPLVRRTAAFGTFPQLMGRSENA